MKVINLSTVNWQNAGDECVTLFTWFPHVCGHLWFFSSTLIWRHFNSAGDVTQQEPMTKRRTGGGFYKTHTHTISIIISLLFHIFLFLFRKWSLLLFLFLESHLFSAFSFSVPKNRFERRPFPVVSFPALFIKTTTQPDFFSYSCKSLKNHCHSGE